MTFRITRHDGEEDDITPQAFDNYDDAYDLLVEIYGDLCYSDADYENHPCKIAKQGRVSDQNIYNLLGNDWTSTCLGFFGA